MRNLVLLPGVAVFVVACGGSDSGAPYAAAGADAGSDGTLISDSPSDATTADVTAELPAVPKTTFGGARPVDIKVPATYDPAKPLPLLLRVARRHQ